MLSKDRFIGRVESMDGPYAHVMVRDNVSDEAFVALLPADMLREKWIKVGGEFACDIDDSGGRTLVRVRKLYPAGN